MSDWFIVEVDERFIRREKERAREIRKSRWWKTKVAEGLCHYCGRRFPPGELTMDHVVPIVRGGTSSRANLVPACRECNNRKKYLVPLEWEEYLERLKEAG